MTQADGWLAGRPVIKLGSIEELLDRFKDAYRGAVVWDERVPATSNLASTIAGCDDLLPLRFDPRDGSLYRRLTQTGRLEVKVRLLRDDGAPAVHRPGQDRRNEQDSSGSAKNDAYRWLIEHYVKTGKANPQVMGYYLDAFWHQSWRASGPANHTLSNHDFVIARRGVLFDLNVWDDEACVDDPAQAPGTDVATLKELLHAAYQRFGGEGVIHVAGFVPWAYKYTHFHGAGGRQPEVPTEWRYAEILSCFNAYMDGGRLGLGSDGQRVVLSTLSAGGPLSAESETDARKSDRPRPVGRAGPDRAAALRGALRRRLRRGGLAVPRVAADVARSGARNHAPVVGVQPVSGDAVPAWAWLGRASGAPPTTGSWQAIRARAT